MKALFFLCLMVVSINAQTSILLHVASTHFDKMNSNTKASTGMDDFNNNNYGIGIEYKIAHKSNSFFSTFAYSELNDSLNEKQMNLSYGFNYKINSHLFIGSNIGLSKKKIFIKDILEYRTIPMAFPRLTYSIGKFDINLIAMPNIKTKGFEMVGIAHLSIGIKIF